MPLIIELPHCAICGQDYLNGEIIAGVRFGHTEAPSLGGNQPALLIDPGQYYEGHYDCVVEAMGPALTLEAIQNSKLPPRDIAMLMGVKDRGRNKKG